MTRRAMPMVLQKAWHWCRWSFNGLAWRDWALWPLAPQVLAASALSLGGLYLAHGWWLWPAREQQEEQGRLLLQQTGLLETQVSRLTHSQLVQKRVQQWAQDTAWGALFLTDAQAMPQWLRALGASAQLSGVRLTSVRPAPLVLQEGLADWPVLVQAQGDFEGLRAWVMAVQSGPLLVKLEHFKLSPDPQDRAGLVLQLRLAAQRPLLPSEWPSAGSARSAASRSGGQTVRTQGKPKAQALASGAPPWREAPGLPAWEAPAHPVSVLGRGPFAEPPWSRPVPVKAQASAAPAVTVGKPPAGASSTSVWTLAPLEQMRLLGGIRDPLQGASLLGLGTAWRLVRVGDALGPNQGTVLEAGPQRLRVRERLPLPGGAWREQERVLHLTPTKGPP